LLYNYNPSTNLYFIVPLGKSLDNILGDYFGQTQISLQPVKNLSKIDALIEEIDLSNIELSPYQTRTKFEASKIESLAKNIQEQGLIQPIIVLRKKFTDTTTPKFVLLAGERRLRAVKLLGQNTILAIVKAEETLSDKQQAMISAMENLQREDLNPIELAQTYKMLMLTQSLDEQNLATLLGNSLQYVKNYLKLLTLAIPVKEALINKLIGEGQARHLIGLAENEQVQYLALIIDKNLTVKEIADLLKKGLKPIKMKVNSVFHNLPSDVLLKADRFASSFPNSKLECKGDLTKGKIVISWNNNQK